jgi:hypothetical protein
MTKLAKILVPVLAGISFISGIAYNSCNNSKEQTKVVEKCCEKPAKKKTSNNYSAKRKIIPQENYSKKRPADYTKEKVYSGPMNARFYIFNSWNDKNENKIADDGELIGIKNEFYSGEKITFGSQVENRSGSSIEGRLLNWNGKLIERFSGSVNFDKCFSYRGHNVSDLLQKSGAGTYKIQWYLDGKFIGQKKFDLIK